MFVWWQSSTEYISTSKSTADHVDTGSNCYLLTAKKSDTRIM